MQDFKSGKLAGDSGLLPLQRWYLESRQPQLSHYNQHLLLNIRKTVKPEWLSEAVGVLARHHDGLRFYYGQKNGSWIQCYGRRVAKLDREDLRSVADRQQLSAGLQRLTHRYHRMLDIGRGELTRIVLVETPEWEEHNRLLWIIHHLTVDEISWHILLTDLGQLLELMYTRTLTGKDLPISLGRKSSSCKQWAERLGEYGQSRELYERLEYWKKIEKYYMPLPVDWKGSANIRQDQRDHHRQVLELPLPLSLCNGEELAGLAEIEPILLAALGKVLLAWMQEEEVVIGVEGHGREEWLGEVDLSRTVGWFNTRYPLLLKGQIHWNAAEWMASVKDSLEETPGQGLDYGVLKYMKSLLSCRLPWDLLFCYRGKTKEVTMDSCWLSPARESADGHIAEDHIRQELIIVEAAIRDNTLLLDWNYSRVHFEGSTIGALAEAYKKALESFIAYGTAVLTDDSGIRNRPALYPDRSLPMLNTEETFLVGNLFAKGKEEWYLQTGSAFAADVQDNTAVGCKEPYSGHTLVDLLMEQTLRTPERVAVTDGEKSYRYAELSVRSNQLGNYLRRKGIKEDALVGMYMEKSIAMITGMLGILKAGGAYVPMDPAYPNDRIRYMLEDTGAKCVLSGGEETMRLRELIFQWELDVEVIGLEDIPLTEPEDLPLTELRPEHLAYVIYTSGSTGYPKGVLVEHRQVVRLFKPGKPLFDFHEGDVWTMFHSYCFDFSVWEIYGALLFGGRLVLVNRETARDVPAFGKLLIREGVTILNQTPSAFYVLQEELCKKTGPLPLRYVIFGGEALDPSKLRLWRQEQPFCRLINMYGITETTVHVTFQELGEEELASARSIIGRAIPTLQVYILSEEGVPSPVGVPGELYVGGAGVARGYLNREELTARRFVPDPFSGRPGSRLYRSGDLSRWLRDGRIEYLGRMDEQVKIRGHRIELGEIMYAIGQSGMVKDNVVLGRITGDTGMQLIGYVIPADGYSREKMIRNLQGKLPDYMLPALWVEIDSLPLTVNGKLDRNALPEPGYDREEASYTAPRNEVEQKIADIWGELLGVGLIGIKDNFFQLGGDSIKVIQAVAKINKEFSITLPVRTLFEYGNIEELASYVTLAVKNEEKSSAGFEVINI